jgi:hypothetical protein
MGWLFSDLIEFKREFGRLFVAVLVFSTGHRFFGIGVAGLYLLFGCASRLQYLTGNSACWVLEYTVGNVQFDLLDAWRR